MNAKQYKLLSLLKILADENKLKIVLHLMEGEVCVCDLAEQVGVERTLVSHHLKSLRDSGFIKDRKVGTWIHCSLNKDAFIEFSDLVSEYLSPELISDKPCCLHDECKCLTKGEKDEK